MWNFVITVLGIAIGLTALLAFVILMLMRSAKEKGPMPKRHGGFGSSINGSSAGS